MILDHYDRHILAQLDKNGRMSLAGLGREIGLSRHAVRDRITRMEEAGVILGFRVVQGGGGVAQERALVFVAFKDRDDDAAMRWLAGLPGTRRLWRIAGEWDAVLAVTVAGPADLARLNDRIASRPTIARSVAHMVNHAL